MSKRLEMLEKVIASGSQDPFHHYARALELRSLGRAEDALEALRGVAERFADYVPTYLMAAQLAVELGDTEQARSLLQRGAEAAKAAADEHALGEITQLLDTLA